MAEQRACEKCKKPFSPTSDRQRQCDECAVCGYCKGPRVAHKAWCKYGGKKSVKTKRAPKKSAARTSKVPRRHSEPAVPANGHEPDRAVVADARVLLRTKVEEQLIDARAEVRALERLLAATE